jgi:hypothetical protein
VTNIPGNSVVLDEMRVARAAYVRVDGRRRANWRIEAMCITLTIKTQTTSARQVIVGRR